MTRTIGRLDTDRNISPETADEVGRDAERAAVAAILLDNELIGRARELLAPRHFGRVSHQKIYEAIVALYGRNERADLITVAEELRKRGDLDVIGGQAAIAQVLEFATTAANFEEHARIVLEHARNRGAMHFLRRTLAEVEKDAGSAAAILSERVASLNGALSRDGAPTSTLLRLSAVSPSRIAWLWSHRIPLGAVTVIAGPGGVGKSCVTLDLIARVSTGRPMPGEPGREPAGAILVSCEDALDAVTVPRLIRAGADLSRVASVTIVGSEGQERPPTITVADLAAVRRRAEEVGARIIVLDPFAALRPQGFDLNDYGDVRVLLSRLQRELAEPTGAAVVLVHHLAKGERSDAVSKVIGSVGITTGARSVLVVGRHPDPSRDERVVSLAKGNLAPADTPSWTYALDVPPGEDHPAVRWCETSSVTADELVAPRSAPEERAALDQAIEYLNGALGDGAEVASKELLDDAPCSRRTLFTAKRQLGVVAVRRGDRWWWSMPPTSATDNGAPESPIDCTAPLHPSSNPTESQRDSSTVQECKSAGQDGADEWIDVFEGGAS